MLTGHAHSMTAVVFPVKTRVKCRMREQGKQVVKLEKRGPKLGQRGDGVCTHYYMKIG